MDFTVQSKKKTDYQTVLMPGFAYFYLSTSETPLTYSKAKILCRHLLNKYHFTFYAYICERQARHGTFLTTIQIAFSIETVFSF